MKAAELSARIEGRLGIKSLTPLQQAASAAGLPARLIMLSPTGSGKTLAFAIPFLRSLPAAGGKPRGIVLVPTRELALQVFEVIRVLAAPDYKTAVCYGGHAMESEEKSLEAGVDIIVSTPGRLLDHLHRGHLDVGGVRSLVLDEYDKSLELGFLPDMKAIASRLKGVSTVILTSATRLPELPAFLGDAPFDTLDYTSGADAAVPAIEFLRVDSPSADKLETLESLLRDLQGSRTIVFVNHRDAAERVYANIAKDGFPATMYHGGLDQDLRERALTLFANGTCPVLVSTDLASRGLDIGDVGAVVHYHLPVSAEALTHRNGRTARMGAEGRAFAIVSEHDKVPDFFPALENYWPEGTAPVRRSTTASLYFNAGRKDKISRGDIVGFLIRKGGLTNAEIGRIDLSDHHAYVAVPADKARETAAALAPHKIKNKRVRVTQVKV